MQAMGRQNEVYKLLLPKITSQESPQQLGTIPRGSLEAVGRQQRENDDTLRV